MTPRLESKTPTWIALLIAIGGAALISYAPAGAWLLTRAAVARIVDFFRGEEAKLAEEIAEKQSEIEAREAALERAREELAKMEARLAEIRQAADEVASEDVSTQDRADLAERGWLADRRPLAAKVGAHGVYR